MSVRALLLLAAYAACALSAPARAGCPSDAEVAAFAADWTALRPAHALPVDTMPDAVCARDKFVAGLVAAGGGPVIGYKAALTAKAVQERFGVSEPVSGVLLERMILPDGADVPAGFGSRPVFEADMLLVVKDEGVNEVQSPEEALRHISAMRPFIELPDLVLASGEKTDGAQLAAINAGARLGIAGAEVPLTADDATVKLFAETRIVMRDGSGATLADAPGSATLGNPLHSVVWLARDLGRSGRRMKAGDLISVGSFSPLLPPKPGQTVTVSYGGFPNTPSVTVNFR